MTNIDEPAEISERKQELERIFSLGAPTYGQVGPRLFSYFGQRLVEMAQIPSGARVLDVASGRGAVLFPAAESAGPNGQVIGIDISEGMVRELSREIEQRRLANVKVQRMDAEYLQFADQTFDVVLIGFAIFFFPQLDRALSEFFRVLKPGGRIAWTTFRELFTEEWAWFEELIESYLESADDKTADEDVIGEPEKPPPVFNTKEGVRAIIDGAGFTVVEVDSETASFIYADEEEFWDSLYSHGSRQTLEEIETGHGAEGLERFKNELFVNLGRIKRPDGIHDSYPVLYTLGTKPS